MKKMLFASATDRLVPCNRNSTHRTVQATTRMLSSRNVSRFNRIRSSRSSPYA
ncbi:hypothetical protein RRSWK_06250 [Rhodopirellula sp. SWK7]|nr:hypothetical protein RRSWK_06250 [Rhodopirellula sp. SWK7]